MKCPECSHKLTTKDYDAAYEWYECSSCEGCFTYDEILEGGTDESDESEKGRKQGDRSRPKGAKAGRGRGKERKDARGAHKGVQEVSKPVAKGKKRRQEAEEDEEALAEHEAEILKPTNRGAGKERKHRDELQSSEVIGVWADEIEDIYHELGTQINEVNARDKALILWREIHLKHGVTAREQEVEHVLCKEHADG